MDNKDLQLIFRSLHNAQETSEQLILSQESNQKKIELLEKRLGRILEKNPSYIDFSIVSITEQPVKKNIQSTVICLKEVEINSQFIDLLKIVISFNKAKEITGVFLSLSDATSTFYSQVLDDESLGFPLSLSSGEPESDLIESLSSLGTTDWTTAKSTFVLLEKLFIEHKSLLGILGKHAGKALNYFTAHIARFSAWPETLRFDYIRSGKIIHSENYHSLQITIKNLSIAQKLYPEFEFKLSTVTNENSDFGSHPRLEFSESCKNAIENWYAESTDDRGQKLELRLAAPNALDTTVWSLLSDRDRLLITGLIGKLPVMVGNLAKAEPSISMRWSDWQSLAVETRSIFVKNMITQRSVVGSSNLGQPA